MHRINKSWRGGFRPYLFLVLLFAIGFCGLANAGLPSPWRFVSQQPQGNDLLAAWAPAPDQLYAGGHGGVIMYWDGQKWTAQTTPTQKTIFAIHGFSRTNVWAVGGDPYTDNITNRCLILRFDGTSWKEMAAPQFSGYTYPFNAVHAVAPNDVWASQDYGTALAHYDGAKWDWVYPPLAVEGSFKAFASAGADHLFVAGTHGQIMHRDHGVWKLEQKLESGNVSFSIITKLWAYDANNVFAAGNWTQFYRRNVGGTWEKLPVNASEPFGIGFCALWGRSPTEIYLMNENSIFFYDGVHPAVRRDYGNQIRRQWFNGAGVGDRLYGVGPGGVVHEYRLDGMGGGTLSALTVGGNLEFGVMRTKLASCGPDGVVVYGLTQDVSVEWPLWHMANGVARRFPTLPPGMAGSTHVKAVVASSLSDVTVAWENLLDWRQGVHRWNGKDWTSMTGAEGTIAFWRAPSGRIYAAGPSRIQYWSDQNGWQTIYTVPPDQTQNLITTLWGRGDNDIFASTASGKILHYNGTSWSFESTPGLGTIVAIAGTASDTYAVGEDGLVWRRAGTTWQKLAGVSANAGEHFTAMAAGNDGVYAAQTTPAQYTGGGLGRLWRFVGTSATLVIQGLSRPLDDLVSMGSGHLIGFASQDFVITDAPAPPDAVFKRLDMSVTTWQPLGSSGLYLRTDSPGGSQPVVFARRIAGAVPFGPDPAPYSEHWILLEDKFRAGTAVPPMQIRIEYDPAKLAPALAGKSITLYRYTSDSATEAPTYSGPVPNTLTTVEPVDFSIWSLGEAVPPPLVRINVESAGRVIVSWPDTAKNYVLENTTSLAPPVTWTVTAEPIQNVGNQYVVTINPASVARFYRLKKPGN